MTALNSLETPQPETQLPHPPGPSGVLHPADNDLDDPTRFLLDLTRDYGDLVRYQTPYSATYIANNPELIAEVLRGYSYPRGSLLKLVLGEGLLSSEGDHWQKQRKLMMPAFHPKVISHFTDEIYGCTLELAQRWREYSARGETIDGADEMLSLTLDVVTHALFSGQMSTHAGSINQTVKTLLADIGGFVRSEFTVNFEISPSRNRAFAKSLAGINELVYEVIALRREEIEKENLRHDLLDLLLETRDEDGVGLSDKEVRDEIVTMLFAGNETTAVMLGWTMHCIALYPEVQSGLRSELASTLDGRAPAVEDMPAMPYLKMMLHEVMRLYPPVWSIFRKVESDGELNGCRIEAGNTMIVSPYTMHRHPDFWPEPERFDPYRFTFENERARPKFAYIPFGVGRHLCVGKHLALLEAQIVISVLTQCFSWKLAPGHVVEHEPLVTLRPKNGLPFNLETRPEAADVIADLMSKRALAS